MPATRLVLWHAVAWLMNMRPVRLHSADLWLGARTGAAEALLGLCRLRGPVHSQSSGRAGSNLTAGHTVHGGGGGGGDSDGAPAVRLDEAGT